jgi:hypothetical protein
LAVREGKRVRLYSRSGRDWSRQLPAVVDAMEALPVRSAVLDGVLGQLRQQDVDPSEITIWSIEAWNYAERNGVTGHEKYDWNCRCRSFERTRREQATERGDDRRPGDKLSSTTRMRSAPG